MPDPDSIASISVSKDRLAATLYIPPGHGDSITLEHLVEAMRQWQVVIDPERLATAEKLLAQYKANPDAPLEEIVARGTPAVDGRDARIDLDESLLEPPDMPEISDDDEGIDHYAQSAFTIVRAGQIIGRLIREEQPVPGFDVTGEPIEATGGAPLDLSGNESVRLTDGDEIAALKSGALVRDENDISISTDLVIEAHVDFSTGNIDFPGDVRIGRGVRDRFRVRARRSIHIGEHIDAAEVSAGLDITVGKGVSGHERARVSAGRDLSAKFINAATVYVGRDAEIEKEMVDTTAVIGRCLRAPKCTVVGGSITLGASGEVAQVGTEGGAPTEIILGRFPQLERIARALTGPLADARKLATRRTARLEQFEAAASDSPEQQEELGELRRQAALLTKRLGDTSAAIQSAAELVRSSATPELIVHKTLHAKSTICLAGRRAEFNQDVAGPVRIHLDAKGEPHATDLERGASTPLAKIAKLTPDPRYMDWKRWTEAVKQAKAA